MRFSLCILLVAATILLVLQTGEVPVQDEECSFRLVRFCSWCDEEGGVLRPVGREFDCGLR